MFVCICYVHVYAYICTYVCVYMYVCSNGTCVNELSINLLSGLHLFIYLVSTCTVIPLYFLNFKIRIQEFDLCKSFMFAVMKIY